MDQTYRQVDLARELNTSEMAISRMMRGLNRTSLPLSELDVIRALTVAELRKDGFVTTTGTLLLVEFDSELRYLHGDPSRKCWIAFVRSEDDREFRLASLSLRHLESVIESVPMSLILPFHRTYARAFERLQHMKSQRG